MIKIKLDQGVTQNKNDLYILYISNESQYSQEQIIKLQNRKPEFDSKNTGLIILNIQDCINKNIFQPLKENQHGVLVLDRNQNLLWHKLDLNFLDLGQAMLDFVHNYNMDVAGVDLLAWGNKILEEGDYLCNDCGYILTVRQGTEFEVGMVFPTCEVCQSGEPEGPTGTIEPFWQKL